MGRLLKWIWRGALVLVSLLLLIVAAVYLKTWSDFSETFAVTGVAVAIPTGEDALAEGRRLARLRGCIGCHSDGNGEIFFELPDGSRIIAPNLFRKADDYTVEQLEAAIRHGVKPDGTSVLGIMPSNSFFHLTDADLGAIIAWMQNGQPNSEALPESRMGPMFRGMMLVFQQQGFQIVAARDIDHQGQRAEVDVGDPMDYGRYLTTTICAECHGLDLKGDEETPDLVIAKAYSAEEFAHLMRTGEPRGGNPLELMAEVAVARFSHFHDDEIAAVYRYLQER